MKSWFEFARGLQKPGRVIFSQNLKIFEILLPSLSNDFGQVLQRKVGLQFFKKFKLAFLKEQKFWARCSFPQKGNVREGERKGE